MATEILRPNGNGNNIWDFHAYTLIDDAIEAPSTAGDSDLVICDRSDDRVRGTWDMSAVTTLTSVTSCRVHLRHKGDSYYYPIDVQLYVGGSWETIVETPNTTNSFVWTYVDFSGSWSPSDFDDALLGLTTGSMGPGDEYQLAVTYFELTGTAPSSSKPQLFSLFVDL